MPLIRNAPEQTGGGALPRLDAASPDERWSAARESGSVSDLASALAREKDARVREAIFTALARIGTVESASAAISALRSDDANLRTGAMDALRAMPDAMGASLPALLADPDDDVRLLACDLARGVAGSGKMLGALIEVEPMANVCAAAVEVLAETGDETAVPALRRCASRFSDDPFLTFAVEAAIGRLNGRG